MTNLEKKLHKFSVNKPVLWIRYVDDVFCIFKEKQDIEDFFNRINRWHGNIKFTKETEVGEKLAFLDVLVIHDSAKDKYSTTLYRKPTNTNLYLLYKSNRCRRCKLGLIRTLTIRILLICSDDDYKRDEMSLMRSTLINNGYPLHLIHRGIKESRCVVNRLSNLDDNKKEDKTIQLSKKSVLLTFGLYGNESAEFAKKVKSICKKYLPLFQVNIAFKKSLTL